METILGIAKNAGKEIMKVRQLPVEEWDERKKEDGSPVTKADLEAHQIICEGLQKHFPDIPIISEEGDIPGKEIRNTYSRYWLVDPLDGTKEFVAGSHSFTVNIALVEENRPSLGIMVVPAQNTLYYAQASRGAFMRDLQKENEQKLEVPVLPRDFSNMKILHSATHLESRTSKLIDHFSNVEKLSLGSSLKMAKLAEGRGHFYPRLGLTMEWDTAAGHIIIEEAGGSVWNADNLLPLTYNKKGLVNKGFFAVGGFENGEHQKQFRDLLSDQLSALQDG